MFRMARHDVSQWLIISTRCPQVDRSVNYNQSKWRTSYKFYVVVDYEQICILVMANIQFTRPGVSARDPQDSGARGCSSPPTLEVADNVVQSHARFLLGPMQIWALKNNKK